MITPPADVHAGLAAGAIDVADLITNHPDAPPLCSLVVEFDQEHERPRVLCQIAARRGALADLVTYADTLDQVTVTLRRFESPTAFTSVSVHADIGGTRVRIWAHPDADELEWLWVQRTPAVPPEPGIDVTVTLQALRAAAEPVAAADEVDEGVSA